MKTAVLALSSFLVLALEASARQFTVINKCAFTIWPAIFTDLNVGQAVPDYKATGWEAPSGHTVTFSVPDNWRAGRIWGRTDCDFSKEGALSCLTGSCIGGLECDKKDGTGIPPVTVGEWTLRTPDSAIDHYDVSLVDGYNLPMTITPTTGCQVVDCLTDLNANCPQELAVKGPDGKTAGCKTACTANLDDNAADSPNCCSGSYDTPETCPVSGIQHYDFFKDGCPNAYAYAYDESSGTALWTCPSDNAADYTVQFC